MITFLKSKFFWQLVFGILGAIAGFMYWRHVGCAGDTCIISSTWYMSSAYGAVFGVLLVRIFTEKN
ncbi:MAG: DUF6132 family protein [Microscillaceae bacterium]|nr:DUF6132 family protein [Microscillaceae bacterium]MDW8461225.1 DUF6132 family protein [Cytophagales bacterium]